MISETTVEHDERSLAEIPAQAYGRIVDVAGDFCEMEQLRRLGFCPGRRIAVVQGGDPMIVSVLGTRIGLRRSLAAGIRVMVEARR